VKAQRAVADGPHGDEQGAYQDEICDK